MNPSIKGKILDERTVKLFVWVVANDINGTNPVIDRNEIDSWLGDVNQIYKQVGIKFEIDGDIKYIPDSRFRNINDDNVARQLVSYPQNPQNPGYPREEDGLEIFFVETLRGLFGLTYPGDGIIVTKKFAFVSDDTYPYVNTDFRTWAHELGHACGLYDIYPYYYYNCNNYIFNFEISNTMNVNSLWIKQDCTYAGIPVYENNSNSFLMSTVGYYRYNLKHVDLIRKLIMCGYLAENGISLESADFSRGDVYGIDMSCIFHDVKTGLDGMVRNPQHDR